MRFLRSSILLILVASAVSDLFATITVTTAPEDGYVSNQCVNGDPEDFPAFQEYLANNAGGVATSDCGVITDPWTVISVNFENTDCIWFGEVEWEISDDCGSDPVTVVSYYFIETPLPDFTSPRSFDINECVVGNPLNHPTVVDYIANEGFETVDGCKGDKWVLVRHFATDYGCSIIGISFTWRLESSCDDFTIYDDSFIMFNPEFPSFQQNPSDIDIDCDDPNYQTVLDNWLNNLGGGTVRGCQSMLADSTATIISGSASCDDLGSMEVRFELVTTNNCGGTSGLVRTATANFVRSSFVTTWMTTSAQESITIPTKLGSNYDYSVDWGDGNVDSGITGDASHTYETAGTYSVSIAGAFPRIFFNGLGDVDKLLSIDRWSTNEWTSMAHAFKGCANLRINATDAPNLSRVTSMTSMFKDCVSLDDPVGHWDVSQVERMDYLFDGAENFNQDISNWNTAKVTTMQGFLKNADNFDQDISSLDYSAVADMTRIVSQSGLSFQNYDRLLGRFTCDGNILNDVNFGAQGIRYCISESARDQLINGFNWTISDGGINGNCITDIVWSGAEDGYWDNCGNWELTMLPSTSSHVIIPSGTGIYPENFPVDSIVIRLLTVEHGAQLRIDAGSNFAVTGEDQ